MAYRKYIDTSKNKKFMQKEYWSHIIYIATDLIVKYTFINNIQVLPPHICHSKDTEFILDYTNKLIDLVKNNNTHQSKMIDRRLFKPTHTNAYKILKLLEYECMNLRPEIGVINYRVEQLNKNRK